MLLICVYTVVYALKVIRVFLLYLLLKVLCESIDHMTLDTTSNILLRTLNGIKSAPPPHTHEGIVLYHLSDFFFMFTQR